MEKAAILFNGIYLSYAVIDEAFTWAKLAHGQLLAVFLSSQKETGEGYIYPSDLDGVENAVSDTTAENEDEAIIQSNTRLLEHRALTEQVILQTTLLHEPTKKQLSDLLSDCTQIFVHEKIEEPGIVTVESIDLNQFLASISVPIKVVQD